MREGFFLYNAVIPHVFLLLVSLLAAFLIRFDFMVPLVFWPRFALMAGLYAALILVRVNPPLAAFVMLALNLATGLVPNSVVIVGSVAFLLSNYLMHRYGYQGTVPSRTSS